MHVIASKAVAFGEALKPEFKKYQEQVIKNTQALAKSLSELGYDMVSGGSDNHLILIDLTNKDITGKDAELALDKAGMTVNKNTVPFETRSPFVTSGIRIGTPAMTTRGMKEEDMQRIAAWMDKVLGSLDNESIQKEVCGEVEDFARAFPLFAW
jgi:glycine hydroxymethyltransferase